MCEKNCACKNTPAETPVVASTATACSCGQKVLCDCGGANITASTATDEETAADPNAAVLEAVNALGERIAKIEDAEAKREADALLAEIEKDLDGENE